MNTIGSQNWVISGNGITTGSSNCTAIGYNAESCITTESNNTAFAYNIIDETTYIVLSHRYHTMLTKNVSMDHYIMLDNKNTKRNVVIYDTMTTCITNIPTCLIDNNSLYHNTNARNAAKHYQKMLPKWLYLYKFFIVDNMLGCPDIFTNVIKNYPTIMTI